MAAVTVTSYTGQRMEIVYGNSAVLFVLFLNIFILGSL